MQLEQFSTPVNESPAVRYARLHRAIDQGLCSPRARLELGMTCLELGKADEALICCRLLPGGPERARLAALLAQRGIKIAAAPPGSARGAVNAEAPTSFLDEVVDAFRFLFEDHMPATLVVATLSFPALMGLGGLLTFASRASWVLALGFLPTVVAFGMILAYAAVILAEAATGMQDPPRVPSVFKLLAATPRALQRFVTAFGLTMGPGAVTMALGVPVLFALPAFLTGALVLPLILHNLELTRDHRSLKPVTLWRTFRAVRRDYAWAAPIVLALLLPFGVVVVATLGSPIPLQVALAGPFFAAPMLVVARLLGRMHHRNKKQLGTVLATIKTKTEPAPAPAAATAPKAPAARTPAPRTGTAAYKRPAGAAPAPGATRPATRPAAPARPAAQARPAGPAAPTAPAAQPARPRQAGAVEPGRPRTWRPILTAVDRARLEAALGGELEDHPELPGLPNIPGLRVLNAEERILAGASPNHPPRNDD